MIALRSSLIPTILIRDQNQSFEGLMAYSITRAGLATHGKASAAWLYEVSGNYFDVLGIRAVSWTFLSQLRRAWAEQQPLHCAELCLLAEPLPE